MKTPSPSKPHSAAVLEAALGPSHELWQNLIADLTADFAGLRPEWKPCKTAFGQVCLLKLKDRTLIYLIPGTSSFEISLVLGERAVALALASDLPKAIKKSLSEARQYAEGRGIRFPLSSPDQIPVIRKLIAIKTTPK